MTSRERLVTALNHKEPDRVPLDLASSQVTGISVTAYKGLRTYLGLPQTEPVMCDSIQQLCLPDDDIFERFIVDTRGLFPVMNHNYDFNDQDDGEYLFHDDDWGLGYRIRKEGAYWYDLFFSPLEGKTLSADLIDQHGWPDGGDPSRIKGLRKQALAFREAGYAVVLKSVCAGLLEMSLRVRGMQDFMIDLAMDKKSAKRILDKVLKVKLDYWETALNELGDVVDVLVEGDDFGTQTSMLISPEMYREIIKPLQKELIGFMKSKAPDAFIFYHSCGNIRRIIPDFIEMGIDIINPVQTTAEGMEPEALKQDFGKDLTFWGAGIDTQGTLPYGKPKQIRDEVKRIIEILAPGGGYVYNTIHNIQADVPPKNIVAMYEAFQEFSAY